MIAFWKYVIIEWKLMVRGAFIWLMMASCGIFCLFFLIGEYPDDIGWHIADASYRYMWFLFLAAQLWAVSTARRDLAAGTYPIHGALPYHSGQLVPARLTALIIPFGILALLPAGTYAYQAWSKGITRSLIIEGAGMFASYVIPVTFIILLGYWIGTWASGRIVYLYSSAIVLFLLLFAKPIAVKFISREWANFFDIGFTDLKRNGFYSELWGFAGGADYWLHHLVYSSLLVILFSGIVYRIQGIRKESKGTRWFYPLVSVSAVIIVMSFINYSSLWKARNTSFEQNMAFYKNLVQENPAKLNQAAIKAFLAGEDANESLNPLTEQHRAMLKLGQRYRELTPASYDLKVDIKDKHQLQIQGTILLHNGGDEALDRFPLSLRHHFQVNAISVDGRKASVQWEPGEDVLWVIPGKPVQPQTSLKLTISYGGKVDDWYYRKGSGGLDSFYWERRSFVDDDRMFLPGYYGWYPYPGTDRLAELEQVRFMEEVSGPVVDEVVNDSQPYRLPADFRVEVETGERMSIVANGQKTGSGTSGGRKRVTFEALGARGFNLVGGNITQWTQANSTAELSITLSDQIPPSRAKHITSRLLSHYTELSKLAKLLKPGTDYPKAIHYIRTEYPGKTLNESFDNRVLFGKQTTAETLKPLDWNGMTYLSYLNKPASMIKEHLSYYDQDLFRQTVTAPTVMTEPLFIMARYLTDAMTSYIERIGTTQEGTLFIPGNYLMNGNPHPVYLALNGVYGRVGEAGFPDALRQMYEFMLHYQGTADDADAAFITLLNGIQ